MNKNRSAARDRNEYNAERAVIKERTMVEITGDREAVENADG